MIGKGMTSFRMKKKGKPVIKCNECGRIINNVKPTWKRAGDIEYYYLQCIYCNAVYTISATDTELRDSIERLKKIGAKSAGRMMTEKECAEMKNIIETNVARSREIKAQYPLEIK